MTGMYRSIPARGKPCSRDTAINGICRRYDWSSTPRFQSQTPDTCVRVVSDTAVFLAASLDLLDPLTDSN